MTRNRIMETMEAWRALTAAERAWWMGDTRAAGSLTRAQQEKAMQAAMDLLRAAADPEDQCFNGNHEAKDGR